MANPVAKRTTALLMRGVKSRPPGKGCHDTYAWEDKDAQTVYFQKKVVYSVEGNSYQRIYDGTFRCKIDETTLSTNNLYTCNYMLFINNSYESMRVYAWITGVRYVSNGTLEIDYIIDDIQTFYWAYTERACFVERMTWNYVIDKPGANTQPEPVNPGDPACYTYERYGLANAPDSTTRLQYFTLLIGTTFDPLNSTVTYQTSVQNGMPTAVKLVRFDVYGGSILYVNSDGTQSTTSLQEWLTRVTESNEWEAIVSANIVPRRLVEAWWNNKEVTVAAQMNMTRNPMTGALAGNYTPRHKKLYTSPYNYCLLTNGIGGQINLSWELFDTAYAQGVLPSFAIMGALSPAMTVYCIPSNYKGGYVWNPDNGIAISNWPAVSIATDSFKAWLAQNQGQLVAGAANTVIGGIAEIVKNPIAGILNLVTGAIDTAGEFWDKSRQPASIKGNQGDGGALVNGLEDFYVMYMSSRSEYLAKCDQFFDMFGYATNEVLSPVRLQGRYYTYWKTAGAIMDGNIPADANSRICSIYDAGVRFWRDEDFGNYVRDKLN